MLKKFNKEYLKFLFPQRTRLMTEYGIANESGDSEVVEAVNAMTNKDYEMIKNFLPDNINSLLDIGCGLALIDFALYNHYNQKVNLFLLDKTNEISKEDNIKGFNQKYIFYNSMSATAETLIENGVSESNLNIFEVSDENLELLNNKKFDLILSLLSCGWHYSIETYIDLILNSLEDDGLLIIDIRHNTGQLEYLVQRMQMVHHIINKNESKHTGGTIGDRYFFKKIK